MLAFYNKDKKDNLFTTENHDGLFEAGQFGGPTTDFSLWQNIF